jgi:hypothetical protein
MHNKYLYIPPTRLDYHLHQVTPLNRLLQEYLILHTLGTQRIRSYFFVSYNEMNWIQYVNMTLDLKSRQHQHLMHTNNRHLPTTLK